MESIYTQTIASRGWHVYGKTSWKNPKKGQTVFAEKEQEKIALLSDPYAVAWKLKHSEKLTASVVGHVPREISRAVSFFLDRGGIVQGTVINEKISTISYSTRGVGDPFESHHEDWRRKETIFKSFKRDY